MYDRTYIYNYFTIMNIYIYRFDHTITDSHQVLTNWFPQINVPSYTFYHSLIKQYIILILLI